MTSILALITGYILDLLFGDPYWMPHPIRLIGKSIQKLERYMYLNVTSKQAYRRGRSVSLIIVGMTGLVAWFVLREAYHIHDGLGFGIESIMYYQILATKCLKIESEKVARYLQKSDLEGARYAVSMIVGRDTAFLDEEGIAKAAVETVAENTCDGIIAPLFYCLLGGAPLGWMYKSINTLDSMIGYQNEKYLYFGRFAAKLDDLVNFIPARVGAIMIIVSSFFVRLDTLESYRIFKRDRLNHKSPNSAQTEAAAAGALRVQLAGDAYYFGKKVHKPTIGDPTDKVTYKTIDKMNQLMITTSFLTLMILIGLKLIGIGLLY